MRARIIGAAVLVGAPSLSLAATRVGRRRRAQQHHRLAPGRRAVRRTGSRSSRPPTPRSRSEHPGVAVNVQYQTWGTHLEKFDATLAGGNAPDVIEMGNTEMTKYMAAGAFQDLTSDQGVVRQLEQPGSTGSPPRAGTTASSTACPYYAGSRVVTYRTDLFKKAGDQGARRASPSSPRPPGKLDRQQGEGLLAGLHRGHRLVRRDELRLRLRRQDRAAGQRQVEGHARLAASRSPA